MLVSHVSWTACFVTSSHYWVCHTKPMVMLEATYDACIRGCVLNDLVWHVLKLLRGVDLALRPCGLASDHTCNRLVWSTLVWSNSWIENRYFIFSSDDGTPLNSISVHRMTSSLLRNRQLLSDLIA